MKNNLVVYLNDHFAGSAGGLLLVTHLAQAATDAAEKLFFHGLRDRIKQDQEELAEIIQEGGFAIGSVRHAVGSAVAHAGIWRMGLNGTGLGELGRFEMIELLAIGIHGKLLLWRTLHEIRGMYPMWNSRDFDNLERSALLQSVGIERYRNREALLLFGHLGEPLFH